MRLILSLLFLAGLNGCNVSGEKALRVNEYFDLDSLLDVQIALIAESNLELNKRVNLNGQIEEETFPADTSRLAGEFKILREFDLNKTNYVGAYQITQSDSSIRYELKPDQEGPVKYLEINNSQEQLNRIDGFFFEDKQLYQHQREIEIVFSNDLIKSYTVKGFQDMLMKDSISFLTEAVFR